MVRNLPQNDISSTNPQFPEGMKDFPKIEVQWNGSYKAVIKSEAVYKGTNKYTNLRGPPLTAHS